jgi:hypothetical protein
MTWNETHERARIIRHAAEAAAADMTGAIPWRDEWSRYFDGPDGLVTALRARLNAMLTAQVDDHSPQDMGETAARIRQSQAGVLRILEAHRRHAARLLPVAPPAPAPSYRPLHFWELRHGTPLPSAAPWR